MAAATKGGAQGAAQASRATGGDGRATGARAGAPWLVRHRTEWRQVGIVAAYQACLMAMMFVPAARSPPVLIAAGLLSFLNAVVIHNHLHRGIFHSHRLNMIWRRVLSFGALYPASANVPSHNLVHHHFADDGQLDWADPAHVRFRWNLLNLIHFPNIAGPNTFAGVGRWMATTRQAGFARQYVSELVVAFGLTGALLVYDFWPALLFVVLPQLYGARCILRINLIQHDRTDIASEWNHSRNFVGRAFNWIMCNNGYHTIHHNRAGLHWSELDEAHRREAVPRIDPSLDEPSMINYLWRTYVTGWGRPATRDVAAAERVAPAAGLDPRASRRAAAERAADAEQEAPLVAAG
jgi:fatty acid desaturase